MNRSGIRKNAKDAETRAAASTRAEVLLSRAPFDMADLPAWLEGLTFSQFDHVWTSAIADLLTREPPSLAVLLHVLRCVRARYHAHVLDLGGHPEADDVYRSLKALATLRLRAPIDGPARGIHAARRRAEIDDEEPDVEAGVGDAPEPGDG